MDIFQGYCYDKWCGSRDLKCKSVWDDSSVSGDPELCYGDLNVKGDKSGNCGVTYWDSTKYIKCAKELVISYFHFFVII